MTQENDQIDKDFRPVVTRSVIYLSLSLYLVTSWLSNHGVFWIANGYGLIPARFSADPTGEAPKLITSLFLHGTFAHLAWNMLFLFIFGRRVEKGLGHQRFFVFYLIAGVAGAFGQHWIDPDRTVVMLGASGAIAGVLGAYLVLHSQTPFTFFRVPAWLILGSWFAGTLFGGLSSVHNGEPEPVFFTHLGGFLAGLLLARPLTSSWPRGGSGDSKMRVHREHLFPKEDDGPFWRS